MDAIPISKFTITRMPLATHLVVEASELRDFRSNNLGRYPIHLSVQGERSTRLFGPVRPQIDREGETIAYVYEIMDRQVGEPIIEVHVLND